MKLNKGFSLVEMLVVMMIIALVAAAATPLLTKKSTTKTAKPPHGRYECYRDASNALYEVKTTETVTSSPAPAPGGVCTFTPNPKAAYFIVTIVGGGGGGSYYSSTGTGGRAGTVQTQFFPKLDATKTTPITPGIGGNAGIWTKGGSGGTTYFGVFSAAGGTGGMRMPSDVLSYSKTCSLYSSPWGLACSPTCSYDSTTDQITIHNCIPTPYTYATANFTQNGTPPPYRFSTPYGDVITIDTFTTTPYNATAGEVAQAYQDYVNTAAFTAAAPTAGNGGTGGGSYTAGKSGAIIIIW